MGRASALASICGAGLISLVFGILGAATGIADACRFRVGIIAGLLVARALGWLWMDPLAVWLGLIVIENWSFDLLRGFFDETVESADSRCL